MYKSFQYRIYPTKAQEELLNKHIGCTRLIYNLALDVKIRAYKQNKLILSKIDLMNQLPDLKEEYPWLKEVNAQCFQQTIINMDNAFKSFFDKKRKKKTGFPKFKSKNKSKKSFRIPQNVKLGDNRLYIRKFKEGIKIKLHRKIEGIIKSATITRKPSGKFYVSILCLTNQVPYAKSKIQGNTTIGIDLGLKDFLTTSSGKKVENPKCLRKAESKLRFTQRKYSKYKGKGKRRKKKLVLLHEKVANQRKDFAHKTSSKLVRDNQSIVVEDLNIEGMLKNHNLAKSISDVGWGMFLRCLKYKCEWYGVNLLEIGRFEPSSKTCSSCGYINNKLTLKDREWICSNCDVVHDRDVNAAINIKQFALSKIEQNILSGIDRKNQDELSTMVEVLTLEAHQF